MRIRDVMTRDFRVIDAGWPRERARDAVARFTTPFIVVRRSYAGGAARLYYVFRRADILKRLKQSRAADTREALGLRESGAAPTVSVDAALQPSTTAQVALGAQGPVGLVVPRRRTRGGTPKLATVLHSPDPGPVTRHLIGDLPSTIAAGATVSLLVSLGSVAPAGAAAAPLASPAGTKIDVVVKPIEGLSLAGAGEGTLEVSDPQSDLPLQFKLSAGPAGPGSVRIFAFCSGAAIATLKLTTSIVAAGATVAPQDQRESTSIAVVPRTQPDLSMYIFERGNELSFHLQSADGHLQMKRFGPTQLVSSPREHFREFFRDIENLPLDTAQQRQVARRRLDAKGSNLFDIVFPDDLKVLLWDLRDRIHTVQITSDEPWIPWEVCRLKGKTAGRVEEGKFFAEAFSVTRWLYGVSAAPRLRFSNWALIVPGDSQLSQAPEEKRYVMSLASPNRKITEVPATYLDVTDAMATGQYDAWHFTGHARADENTDADQSAIELSNREVLTPEDVAGQVENVLQPRPFVFLNACQSARGGLSLTGVGGWAQRFLKPGSTDQAASAFVGSYWSVFDEAALAFAKALYQGLLADKPIGQAAKEARLAISGQEDPTWLAYTVYADPHATVEHV